MKKRCDQRGSSIVEVMVAFLILLIGVAAFSVSLMSAVQTIGETRAMRGAVQEVMKTYYTDGLPAKESSNIDCVFNVKGTGTQDFSITMPYNIYSVDLEFVGNPGREFVLYDFEDPTP